MNALKKLKVIAAVFVLLSLLFMVCNFFFFQFHTAELEFVHKIAYPVIIMYLICFNVYISKSEKARNAQIAEITSGTKIWTNQVKRSYTWVSCSLILFLISSVAVDFIK